MNDPASPPASSVASVALEDTSPGAVTRAKDDSFLLCRYAEEGSESAFTELVRRHVDLVYGVALRRTNGDTHRAADVAQQVFTALARDAKKLSRHTVLAAWLHTATRNAALNLMISEQRRQAREHEAQALAPPAAGPNPDWERLRPVLDAAIDELPEPDREAVVLRFLERRAFAEIGAALRVSEDAARMRTERALEKLREALARRGITSTAAAIGAIVSSQPVLSAPTGLAAMLAAQSLATAGAGTGLVGALTSLMNLKIVTAGAVGALVFFGAGAYVGLMQHFDAAPPPPLETPKHTEMIASLRRENLSLKAEVGRLEGEMSRMTAASAKAAAPSPAAPPPEAAPISVAALQAIRRTSQQKAILNNLRQIAAARDQFILENARPPASLDELVGEKKYIKRMTPVAGETYAGLALGQGGALSVTSTVGMTVTYDPAGGNTTQIENPATPEMTQAMEFVQRVVSSTEKAIQAYRGARGDMPPMDANPEALIPYFASPQEGADFVEYIGVMKALQKTMGK